MNVLLYTRVSTDEQAEGNSLDYQSETLREYCKLKNYNVIAEYADDYSAKDFIHRPKMQEMMKYCKQHNKEVDMILFLKWDRYSRNLEGALENIRYFKSLNIKVNAIQNPLDLDIPENKLLLAVYLSIPEIDNDKRSINVRECIYQAKLAGKCTNMAPRGYVNKQIDDKHKYVEVVPKDAEFIKRIFNEVAEGLKSPNYIRKQYEREGFKMSLNAFMNMLRNPFYCGIIYVPPFQGNEAQYVQGIHEPIIDKDLFDRVQAVLGKKSNHKPQLTKKVHPDLFLRKYVVCPICGKPLTGAASKGNGGRYYYYNCSADAKHFRCRADQANHDFVKYVSQLSPNEVVLNLYNEVLNDLNAEKTEVDTKNIECLKENLKSLKERKSFLEDKFIDGELEKSEYTTLTKRLSERIKEAEGEIEKAEMKLNPQIIEQLDYSISLIQNMGKYIEDAPVEVKCKLIGSMFPEKIVYDKKNYRTNSYNKVLDLIYQETKLLQNKKVNKSEESPSLFTPVLRAGIEPARLLRTLDFESSASTNSAT